MHSETCYRCLLFYSQTLEHLKMKGCSLSYRISTKLYFTNTEKECVFCRIARREEPGTALLPCEDEDLVCFRDIKPGAPHHYLVVPVKHMGNCKTLKTEHIPLVKRMMEVGKAVLQKNNFNDLNDVRMGFHWPPFCSIAHLHLHVLAPASQLGFLSRIYYRINSYWFITVSVMQVSFAVGFQL
uniref:Adenosine 5'-monophosphoramidase HINT3 n=1 Tax=Ficedula albicollis TaxID=59894 RepID=A0A803VY97_FICAL